jgi:hypothetical protein
MKVVVRVTFRSGDDVSHLKVLLDRVRAKTGEVKVFEAPRGIEYSYSFPVVTISDQGRHFGEEAVEVLESLAG